MFYLSKFLSVFTQPLTWAVVLLLLALWWLPRRPHAARRALQAALGLTVLVGWLPLPDALVRQLENRHPAPESVAAGQLEVYSGMVVLGGVLEAAYISQGRGQVALNDAAERMTVPVALMRQNPHLQLLFTGGGDGELGGQGLPEADRAKLFFSQMGVPPERVLYERASRTTYENAILSAGVPGVDKTQPWLLVTSAWHMPRALATFRAAGWNVTPYPVDYRTGSRTPWTDYSLVRGALRWQLVLHEWVGLAAYAVAGRAAVF